MGNVDSMNRADEMLRIGKTLEAMVNRYNPDPISISYDDLNKENSEAYSTWDRERFGLHTGEEAFFVYRRGHLLYVVPVGADSYLTAADELMQLLAKKF